MRLSDRQFAGFIENLRRGAGMGDSVSALKVLIVSDSTSDRAALREAAGPGAVVIEMGGGPAQAAAVRARVAAGDIDVVFLDATLPHEDWQAAIAARPIVHPPLVVSIGAGDSKIGIAFPINGVIARPVQAEQARAVFAACLRARMPNRILLVDDSATVRSVIRKVLQSCCYRFEVEDAADGVTALQRAGKQRFDVVMLDCNMPGIDSFTTLGMILQSHAETKVVMITTTNNSKAADKARASGAHDVLYKPFYAKDIDVVMDRLSGLSRPKSP